LSARGASRAGPRAGSGPATASAAVTSTPTSDVLTGLLDGTPVTIAAGVNAPLSDEFEQRAGAALGVPVDGGIALLERFTRTGAR
jgi:hypothetical protein